MFSHMAKIGYVATILFRYPPFKPSKAIFAGHQRRGICKRFLLRGNESAYFSIRFQPCTLSAQISMPPDTADAMTILRLTNNAEMGRFLDRRIEQIESLNISISRERTEWGGSIPPPILSASRIIDAPLLDYLVRASDLGGPT